MGKTMEPRRRKSDDHIVVMLWDFISPYWQLISGVFFVITAVTWWVNDVSAYGPEITKQAAQIKELQENQKGMATDVAVTKQRVIDIANFMGVPSRRGNRE